MKFLFFFFLMKACVKSMIDFFTICLSHFYVSTFLMSYFFFSPAFRLYHRLTDHFPPLVIPLEIFSVEKILEFELSTLLFSIGPFLRNSKNLNQFLVFFFCLSFSLVLCYLYIGYIKFFGFFVRKKELFLQIGIFCCS